MSFHGLKLCGLDGVLEALDVIDVSMVASVSIVSEVCVSPGGGALEAGAARSAGPAGPV